MRPRADTSRRPQGWRPPTRRAFVAMLGAAAAALATRATASRPGGADGERPERRDPGKPIWIGHF